MKKIIEFLSANTQEVNENYILKKPSWIKVKLPKHSYKINAIKHILREHNLKSVCQEAHCPNLSECFHNGIVTFMILGPICTRRCPFCAVSKGRPNIVDHKEPKKLAKVILKLNIKYVVITSVNRDDLKDGGSNHFIECIRFIRKKSKIKIEILVPDFRHCMNQAIRNISLYPPDVFNHNIENVPRLYKYIRPGADYNRSLQLLKNFKYNNPNIPTKSGLMLGLGETEKEILNVMKDLRLYGVSILTLGQYLQPSKFHLPVVKYFSLKEFQFFKSEALALGFTSVLSGPLVRSSYHAVSQYIKSESA